MFIVRRLAEQNGPEEFDNRRHRLGQETLRMSHRCRSARIGLNLDERCATTRSGFLEEPIIRARSSQQDGPDISDDHFYSSQ